MPTRELSDREGRSAAVFEQELVRRKRQHARFSAAGQVSGVFESDVWKYKGRGVTFHELQKGNRLAGSEVPLRGFAGRLARCIVIQAMLENLSLEGINARLYGFKWLHQQVGDDQAKWIGLNQATLDKTVVALQKQVATPSVYNRVNGVVAVVKFLNTMVRPIEGVRTAFLLRRIRWSHGVKNPIRARLDPTSEASKKHSEKKYLAGIQLALGEARSRIRQSPVLEPSPGYDLIRLEALAFCASLGLRIGEVTSLPVNAFDHDDHSGVAFVRVMTEKGELPTARPVSDLWESLINEANDYLLNQCASARERARQIELNGFQFVRDALWARRQERPLSGAQLAQLAVLKLSPDRHAFVNDIVACLDVSGKEFCIGGRFYQSSVPLPRIAAARLLLWMDARFSKWDWINFVSDRVDKRTNQVGKKSLSVKRVGMLAGISSSCLPKADWFYRELRDLLTELSKHHVFTSEFSQISPKLIAEMRARWIELENLILARSGGGKCTVIDVDMWCEELMKRHTEKLEWHFQETLESDEGSIRQVPVTAGVPSKLSEHLIVLWEFQFTGFHRRGILPRPICRADFYNYICSNGQKRTVFERLDMRDSDGRVVSMTPHQIRHWVTTAMLRSGPSEMMVDLWMGRKVGQSRHYDHRTASERAEAVRGKYTAEVVPDDFLGRKVRFWRESGYSAEQIEHFVKSKLRVMHFVPWGRCSRELFTSPCTRGLMCLRGFGTDSACESFHIDPTSDQERESIRTLRDTYMTMLRALEPHIVDIRDALVMELNASETLDQHIRFIMDVVRGCEQALRAYEVGQQRINHGDVRPIAVACIEGSKQ